VTTSAFCYTFNFALTLGIVTPEGIKNNNNLPLFS